MGDFFLELMSTRSTQEESTMDRTANTGFEGIAQMLLEQKNRQGKGYGGEKVLD